MIRKLLCFLGFHDWWYFSSYVRGEGEEHYQCSYCGKVKVIKDDKER